MFKTVVEFAGGQRGWDGRPCKLKGGIKSVRFGKSVCVQFVVILVSSAVNVWLKALFIEWIRDCLLPGERICNFIGEVVVIEWVPIWGVCHESGVVRRAQKFPVCGKGVSFYFKLYFDCFNFLLTEGLVFNGWVLS